MTLNMLHTTFVNEVLEDISTVVNDDKALTFSIPPSINIAKARSALYYRALKQGLNYKTCIYRDNGTYHLVVFDIKDRKEESPCNA